MTSFRSAGALTIGEPRFDNASKIFSVDFIFEAKAAKISEEEIQSAALQVATQTKKLLAMNGFWKHGDPETRITPVDAQRVHFLVAVRIDVSTTPYVVLNPQ